MRIIERAESGNPARAAYCLCCDCRAPLTWAMRVVEQSRTGDLASAVYCLRRYCQAPLAWAERVVLQVFAGDPIAAARYLRDPGDSPWEQVVQAAILAQGFIE